MNPKDYSIRSNITNGSIKKMSQSSASRNVEQENQRVLYGMVYKLLAGDRK